MTDLRLTTLRLLVSLSATFAAATYAVEELRPHFEFKEYPTVWMLAFSPDSTKLIVKPNRNGEPVTLRDVHSGKILCAWAMSIRISSNIAPNGRWLFVDTVGKNDAHLRDITNCDQMRYLNNLPIYHHFDTRFSADGRRIAGTAHPRRPIFNRHRWVYIYDMEEEKVLNHVSHRSSNFLGMWDDKFHYFRDGETVLLWTQVNKKARTSDGHKIKLDRRVLVQNVLTEEIHREWHFRSKWYQVAVEPDETKIAIFERESMTLRIEDLLSGVKHAEWTMQHIPKAMEYHPSGRWLVTVSSKGLLTIFDVKTQQVAGQSQIIERVHSDGLTFAPNGKFFAIDASEGRVAVYPFQLTTNS